MTYFVVLSLGNFLRNDEMNGDAIKDGVNGGDKDLFDNVSEERLS
jgi:hypothetical protein